MIAHAEREYTFIYRSGGVVVLKGCVYVGFFESLDEALYQVFGG